MSRTPKKWLSAARRGCADNAGTFVAFLARVVAEALGGVVEEDSDALMVDTIQSNRRAYMDFASASIASVASAGVSYR
eukprot:scaffold282895_cov28-Tisochrysis_lutea.AAC.3